jgi:hypothetical protein
MQQASKTHTARSAIAGVLLCVLFSNHLCAWSNRGHRLINRAAVLGLPGDMPAFIRSEQAVRTISYLGPEPDRWRPGTESELSATSAPDHGFFLEAGGPFFPLPRTRYDYLQLLTRYRQTHPDAASLATPARTGMMPWQVLEVFERLKSAFRSYRVLTGELPVSALKDIQPMTAEDLPEVEQSCLFYAGWLGHYLGDGSQPLHSTINSNGWVAKENPQGFTTQRGIHSQLEAVADEDIAVNAITLATVQASMTPPRYVSDIFTAVIPYLRASQKDVDAVYQFEKKGELKAGSSAIQAFCSRRMAAGASMLRDAIYSAWIQSKDVS